MEMPSRHGFSLFLLLPLLLSYCENGGPNEPPPEPEAYFEFRDVHGDLFVFKLVEAEKIEHARALLSGAVFEGVHVGGTIVKEPAEYNPAWSYHLDPMSIEFFDFSIEVSDAAIAYVEEHLDEVGGAFLPESRWTPWTSELTREVTDEIVTPPDPVEPEAGPATPGLPDDDTPEPSRRGGASAQRGGTRR